MGWKTEKKEEKWKIGTLYDRQAERALICMLVISNSDIRIAMTAEILVKRVPFYYD